MPKVTRNFYFLVGATYIVWMLFFDANDWVTQISNTQKLKKLYKEKTYYQELKETAKREAHELESNPELLEKFAREKYLMHKEGEEVFVTDEKPYSQQSSP